MFLLTFTRAQEIYLANGKFGFSGTGDTLLVSPEYDFAVPFIDGYPWTIVGYGKYGEASDGQGGSLVRFTGKFGLINRSGTEIVNPRYDMVVELLPRFAIVGQGEGYLQFINWPGSFEKEFSGVIGLVDRYGKEILTPAFSALAPVCSDSISMWMAKTDPGDGYSLYDAAGNQLGIARWDTVYCMFENRIRVSKNNMYGFVDTAGKLQTGLIFSDATDYRNGLALVIKNDTMFYIDYSGTKTRDFNNEFEIIDPASEGMARVKLFGKYGFINMKGELIFPPEFSEATPFFNGLAAVESITDFGYLQTDGTRDLAKKYTDSIVLPDNNEVIREIPDYAYLLEKYEGEMNPYRNVQVWNLPLWMGYVAENIRMAPWLNYHYPHLLNKICAGEGLLTGRYDMAGDFMAPGNDGWEKFKKMTLLPVISNEKMRLAVWEWAKPVFRNIYLSMPRLHRDSYLELLEYLSGYITTFDAEKTQEFLAGYPDEFAYRHYDGTTSEFRKASAQLDRLILIYQTITPGEAKEWILRIHTEVSGWED